MAGGLFIGLGVYVLFWPTVVLLTILAAAPREPGWGQIDGFIKPSASHKSVQSTNRSVGANVGLLALIWESLVISMPF